MPNLNPFAHKISSYHRLPDHSADGESDTCVSSDPSALQEHYATNKELLHAKESPRSRRSCFMHTCGYFFVALLSLSIGLGLNQLLDRVRANDGYLAPYDISHHATKRVFWSVNNSYTGEPTAETDKTWANLIPLGRGFIEHPTLATDMKSISVFHEIHCLHGLRQAYYKNTYLLSKLQNQPFHARSPPHTGAPHIDTDAAASDEHADKDHPSLSVFTPNPYMESLLLKEESHRHDHITHCFEYLRQALICAADTNLEDLESFVDEQGNDRVQTDGWGTERVCRDFEAVKVWAERWRTEDWDGIV